MNYRGRSGRVIVAVTAAVLAGSCYLQQSNFCGNQLSGWYADWTGGGLAFGLVGSEMTIGNFAMGSSVWTHGAQLRSSPSSSRKSKKRSTSPSIASNRHKDLVYSAPAAPAAPAAPPAAPSPPVGWYTASDGKQYYNYGNGTPPVPAAPAAPQAAAAGGEYKWQVGSDGTGKWEWVGAGGSPGWSSSTSRSSSRRRSSSGSSSRRRSSSSSSSSRRRSSSSSRRSDDDDDDEEEDSRWEKSRMDNRLTGNFHVPNDPYWPMSAGMGNAAGTFGHAYHAGQMGAAVAAIHQAGGTGLSGPGMISYGSSPSTSVFGGVQVPFSQMKNSNGPVDLNNQNNKLQLARMGITLADDLSEKAPAKGTDGKPGVVTVTPADKKAADAAAEEAKKRLEAEILHSQKASGDEMRVLNVENLLNDAGPYGGQYGGQYAGQFGGAGQYGRAGQYGMGGMMGQGGTRGMGGGMFGGGGGAEHGYGWNQNLRRGF